jgi:hypothetical protein
MNSKQKEKMKFIDEETFKTVMLEIDSMLVKKEIGTLEAILLLQCMAGQMICQAARVIKKDLGDDIQKYKIITTAIQTFIQSATLEEKDEENKSNN